jgi:thioredoxin-like negative regulator of GroEL
MAPVFDALAKEYAGLVKFVKVNIDEEPALAGQFRVQSIPTLLVFHQGRPVDGAVGALPKSQLQSLLYSVLANTRQAAPATPTPAT